MDEAVAFYRTGRWGLTLGDLWKSPVGVGREPSVCSRSREGLDPVLRRCVLAFFLFERSCTSNSSLKARQSTVNTIRAFCEKNRKEKPEFSRDNVIYS